MASSTSLNGSASIIFIGDSYTFGRIDPIMHYNAANVRDLTAPSNGGNFTNTTGSNPYEPHPWGGVPGVFKEFTDESGLSYSVAISARNAASLQGQYLDSNPAGWDLRGNLASQAWDTVVLQDNSTQALHSGSGSITFAAGSSTAQLILTPVADTTVETDETVGITLAAGTTYRVGTTSTLTGTILNDDPTGPTVNPSLPTITLSANPAAVLEDSGGKLVYTFTLSKPLTTALTVQFTATRDGSTSPSVATSGTNQDFLVQANGTVFDYESNGAATTGSVSFTSGTGSIVIPAGATTATITLAPKADTTVENDESMYFGLSANSAYNVGTQGTVSATIVNDDFASGTDTSLPNITVDLPQNAVYEDSGNQLVYTFTRTGSNASALTVNFGVNGTATLPGNDFTVAGATTFQTAGAPSPNITSFQTYATKLAQYAITGAADPANNVPANTNADPASQVYLYETWARPNLITGALVANTDPTTGAITNTSVSAPVYYTSLEGMTADLVSAYQGLAASNPIFAGVAPVGAAFLAAVQNGTAIRDPYTTPSGTSVGNIDLWWDDNLHASKYGSYLSSLTLFGTITGIDPRSLGSSDKVASDIGIDPAVAAALQNVAAATIGGFTTQATWTAPGKVTVLPSGSSGLLASAGGFTFSDSNTTDTHTVSVSAPNGALGTLTANLHVDTTGDGTGGAVNWTYTVDDSAVSYLGATGTRVEHFLINVTDQTGSTVQRDVSVTIYGTASSGQLTQELYSNGELATYTYNSDGSYATIQYTGISNQPYSGYTAYYSGGILEGYIFAGVSGSGTPTAVTLNADGTLASTTYSNVAGQAYTGYTATYNEGVLSGYTYANVTGSTAPTAVTFHPNGTLATLTFANVSGQAYTGYTETFSSGGVLQGYTYAGVTSSTAPVAVALTPSGSVLSITYANFTDQAFTGYTATYTGGVITGYTYAGVTNDSAPIAIALNTDGTLASITYANVTDQAYTGYTATYNEGVLTGYTYAGVTSDSTPVAVTRNTDGTLASVTYANVTDQAYTGYTVTYNEGVLTGYIFAGVTDDSTPVAVARNPDGSLASVTYAYVTGAPYTGYTDIYGSGGSLQAVAYNGVTGDSNGAFAVDNSVAPVTELLTPDSYAGGTTLSNATLELGAVGAAGGGAITFTGAGTLQLDAASLTGGNGQYDFANAISGATTSSEVIDLRSLAYVPGQTSASLNGTTVSVGNGTSSVTLHLAAAQPGSTFKTADDNHGGTLVYDPPAATAGLHQAPKADMSWISMAMEPFGGNGVLGDAHHGATPHDPYGAAALAAPTEQAHAANVFGHPHGIAHAA